MRLIKFILGTIILKTLQTHKCIHDSFSEEIGTIMTLKSSKQRTSDRFLSETKKRPINIQFEFQNDEEVPPSISSYLSLTIIPIVKKRIEQLIFLSGEPEINRFDSTSCDSHFTIPEIFSQKKTKADLIVFLKLSRGKRNVLAFASACLLEEETNRPVVGFINVNFTKIDIKKKAMNDFIYTIIHELFHILAFSPQLFQKFPNSASFALLEKKTKTGQFTVFKFFSENMLSVAKEHFKCNEIKAVDLENEGEAGSAGSHFEKTLLGNEIMTADTSGYSVLSAFSLALLEDSGWYEVNFDGSESLGFGKNAGCPFLAENCQYSSSGFVLKKERLDVQMISGQRLNALKVTLVMVVYIRTTTLRMFVLIVSILNKLISLKITGQDHVVLILLKTRKVLLVVSRLSVKKERLR